MMRQGSAKLFLNASAGMNHIPADGNPGGFQNPHGGLGDLRPNAITGDKGYIIAHQDISLA
jgi:hypothetical protein